MGSDLAVLPVTRMGLVAITAPAPADDAVPHDDRLTDLHHRESTLHPLLNRLAALLLMAGTAPLAAAPDDSFDPYVALSAPVVVNLANPQRATYLQIAADLQVDSATDKEVVNNHMPVIRDTLILVFGGREPSEVREAANREALREEALTALREALEARSGRPAVNAIYFSSFLVQ